MATAFLSDQETLFASSPPRKMGPAELGKPYIQVFTKTLASSGLAIADTIDLCDLPVGARVLFGEFCWSATQGATATTAIGIAGNTGKYFAAAVTASTAKFEFVATQALGYNTPLTAAEQIVATNAAAAWTASSVLRGYILYTL
jgi:hypothetical protein